jgi:2,4-dienoyl-CoA reductase-like NADH-dependent reductase (Old Yellow Enzyme family)
MTPLLFTPLALGSVTVPNRIAIAPMCQYSADDGSMTDWHLQHIMRMAMSGCGLVIVEATAVERRGRITHGCTGLYSDANERAAKRVIDAAKAVALQGTKFGVQLAHAGRKASSQRPWEGGAALKAHEDPWQTVGPSAVPFGAGWHTPQAMTEDDIEGVIKHFAAAAERAVRVGYEVLELHMAHGYLMHSFCSPISNQRTDRWGGSLEKRLALPLAVMKAVRAAVPQHVAVGARITGTDWLDGGMTIEDAIVLAKGLKALDGAYACVSSGAASADVRVPVGPLYQVPLAEKIKAGSGIVTRAVGLITTAEDAERVLKEGKADQIAVARAILDDPHWGLHAADALGVTLPRPPQYDRASPAKWPGTRANAR